MRDWERLGRARELEDQVWQALNVAGEPRGYFAQSAYGVIVQLSDSLVTTAVADHVPFT
jgi:hypothetical protein